MLKCLKQRRLLYLSLTFITMMPATRKVILNNLWCLIFWENSINLMLLAPHQWLWQHLPCLFHIEVSCSQEPQKRRITRNLDIDKHNASHYVTGASYW